MVEHIEDTDLPMEDTDFPREDTDLHIMEDIQEVAAARNHLRVVNIAVIVVDSPLVIGVDSPLFIVVVDSPVVALVMDSPGALAIENLNFELGNVPEGPAPMVGSDLGAGC